MSTIDNLIRISRELKPETWERVDHIAQIIDPGAFAEWWSGIGPNATKHEPDARQRYMQSKARQQAWTILQYLGIEPETFDWLPIFERLAAEATAHTQAARGERGGVMMTDIVERLVSLTDHDGSIAEAAAEIRRLWEQVRVAREALESADGELRAIAEAHPDKPWLLDNGVLDEVGTALAQLDGATDE